MPRGSPTRRSAGHARSGSDHGRSTSSGASGTPVMRNAMTSLWQPWEGPRVIAVCGEAIVDLLPSGPTSYDVTPGGSPANTAVAIARLGVPVTMLARLSGDDFGRLLREHLSSNGVDLSRAVAAAEPSGVAVVTRDADGTASYRFLLDGAADWQWTDAELGPLPDPVVALHSGSIALATTPAIERLLERSRDKGTISIDPNLRPSTLEASRQALPLWLALADIIKASADDI